MAKYQRNMPYSELRENKEEFRIIWLDTTIDESNQTETMLLEINPAAQFYTEPVQCMNVIKLMKNEQILLIISGSLVQDVLPYVHQLPSIVAIFIFCTDRQEHPSLMNNYHKIVEIAVNQNDLVQSLRQKLNLEKQRLTFHLFDDKQKSSRNLSKEFASFLWHQLLVHILEQIPQNDQSKQEFLAKCTDYYQSNPKELNNIDRFRQNYSREQAIEWYTEDNFLHKLLNKALRTENMELIYFFRFLIIDLCSEIKREHHQLKNNGVFTAYRGQKISTEELEKWKNNIGTIISINGFFSTSRDINISLKFAYDGIISHDIQRILFEIEVDPSLETIICADISQRTKYPHEQEVLFNLNSLFKIISVHFIDEILRIKLKTTDDGARNLKEHLQYIQQEIDEGSSTIYFGWLLMNELGQINQAEKYFQMLLKTFPADHPDRAGVYNGLGSVHSKRKNWNLALENYRIALDIRQKQLPPQHHRIVASLHNVANIEREKGNLDQALDYFQKALDIEENNYLEDHLQKATIILNIGNTYTEKDELDTALKYLSRASDMFGKLLPEKHPTISTCLSDTGVVHAKRADYKRALDSYHQALEMDEVCLPFDHPHLLKDLKNIVFTYLKNGELNKALELCQKKRDDLKNIPGDHPISIAQILMIMAKLLDNKNLNEAVQYCKEALDYLQNSIPIDELMMGKCHDCLGSIYAIHSQFDHALLNLLKALVFYRRSLIANHTDIAKICRIIALCYQKTNKPLKAHSYFNESHSIYQANYGANHKDVKLVEDDIARLNGEQPMTINLSELIEKNVSKEEQTITNSPEPIEKLASDELPIAIITDSGIPPLPLPIIDSPSARQSDAVAIESKPKTSGKCDICSKCEIL